MKSTNFLQSTIHTNVDTKPNISPITNANEMIDKHFFVGFHLILGGKIVRNKTIYWVFFSSPLKSSKYKKVNQGKVRCIWAHLRQRRFTDSPNLGFPYFLGGTSEKKHPVQKKTKISMHIWREKSNVFVWHWQWSKRRPCKAI